MRVRRLGAGVLLLAISGCPGLGGSTATRFASASEISDKAALMQTSRDWAKAAASGDVDRILSFWVDTAIVLEPDRPALVGKAAIRKMVVGSMKLPGFSITWEPERAWVSLSGDVGYLIERNKVSFADSTGRVHTHYGKAVTVWTKDDNGDWKNVVNTWNRNPTERVFAGP
jgi:ketosteroid isomerase-like protein